MRVMRLRDAMAAFAAQWEDLTPRRLPSVYAIDVQE
jgi:hypothetical protein